LEAIVAELAIVRSDQANPDAECTRHDFLILCRRGDAHFRNHVGQWMDQETTRREVAIGVDQFDAVLGRFGLVEQDLGAVFGAQWWRSRAIHLEAALVDHPSRAAIATQAQYPVACQPRVVTQGGIEAEAFVAANPEFTIVEPCRLAEDFLIAA